MLLQTEIGGPATVKFRVVYLAWSCLVFPHGDALEVERCPVTGWNPPIKPIFEAAYLPLKPGLPVRGGRVRLVLPLTPPYFYLLIAARWSFVSPVCKSPIAVSSSFETQFINSPPHFLVNLTGKKTGYTSLYLMHLQTA